MKYRWNSEAEKLIARAATLEIEINGIPDYISGEMRVTRNKKKRASEILCREINRIAFNIPTSKKASITPIQRKTISNFLGEYKGGEK